MKTMLFLVCVFLVAIPMEAASTCFSCESDASNWFGTRCVNSNDLSPGEGGTMCSNEESWHPLPLLLTCGTGDDVWNPTGGAFTEYWCLDGRWHYRRFSRHLGGNACPPFQYEVSAAEGTAADGSTDACEELTGPDRDGGAE